MLNFTGQLCQSQSAVPVLQGLKHPTAAELQSKAISETSLDPNIVDIVDLSIHMPPVDQQGAQGACTAWAMAYYLKSYYEKVRNGYQFDSEKTRLIKQVFSPGYLYDSVRALGDKQNLGCISGISFDQGLRFMMTKGVVHWANYPYDSTRGDCQMYDLQKFRVSSPVYKIENYDIVNVDDINVIRQELKSGRPVLTGLLVKDNLVQKGYEAVYRGNTRFVWKPGNTVQPKDTILHAVLCVGFDDKLRQLKFVNSWGSSWGNGGYFYIPYDKYKNAVLFGYTAYNSAEGMPFAVPALPLNTKSVRLGSGAVAQYNDTLEITRRSRLEKIEISLSYIDSLATTIVVQFRDFEKDSILQNVLFRVAEVKSFFYLDKKYTFHFAATVPTSRKLSTGEHIDQAVFDFTVSRKREKDLLENILDRNPKN
ncbi:C1 family peptidase [Dyadobacter sp. CY312]|uniref:C1 family peptidase n=1 Tax=Dyadobacter sp. CY312 TaxID=2907303 RepID=UPI001F46CF4A|nr:C1 family peptidase [Dyadobacter sp. CY312]MCE7044058.1 C1 family peptidase [Dyadobacter sp. CY312]